MNARRLVAPLLATVALGTGGCTLVKPITGAVAGPFLLLAGTEGNYCGCNDGRAILIVIVGAAGVGAAIGLVTGIISDLQALTGDARDPIANWWDPFKTNTSAPDGCR